MATLLTGTRIWKLVYAKCKIFAQITRLSTSLLVNGTAFLKLVMMTPTTGIQSCACVCATLKFVRTIIVGI
jgi:hypothetical protein